jgi:hypothetical protein
VHHGNVVRLIEESGPVNINPCPDAFPYARTYAGTENWYCYKNNSNTDGVCSYSGKINPLGNGSWHQNQSKCANAMDEAKKIELRKIYTYQSDDSQINTGYRALFTSPGNKIVYVRNGESRKEYIARIPMGGKKLRIIKVGTLSAIDPTSITFFTDDDLDKEIAGDTKIDFKFRHTDNSLSTLGTLTLNRIPSKFMSTQKGRNLPYYTQVPGFTIEKEVPIPNLLKMKSYDYFKDWIINFNYNKTFKSSGVNKDKPVKYLELYPSKYIGGSLIYLGFKNLMVL